MTKTGNIPIGPIQQDIPTFGNIWYVASGGDSGNSGQSPTDAFDTITDAITAQAAGTDSLGDIIYVMYGNYVGEEIAGNLTACQLIGVTGGGTPEGTSIRPNAGSAYTGTLTNAAIRNIDFRQSSSSDQDHAVLEFTNMDNSIIDNCAIISVADVADSKGILIGGETEVASEFFHHSRITNCFISTYSMRNAEFDFGIRVGMGATHQATRLCRNSVIADNRIYAMNNGIRIDVGPSNGHGSVISGNVIASNQNYGMVAVAGIKSVQTDQLIMVCDNRVTALDAISGFTAGNVLQNITNENGTVSIEGPAMQ